MLLKLSKDNGGLLVARVLHSNEVVAGRVYTFPENRYVSLWITDNPFGSKHGEAPYFKVKYKKEMISVSLPSLKMMHKVPKGMQMAVDMALVFAESRVDILISRYQDAIAGKIPAPID